MFRFFFRLFLIGYVLSTVVLNVSVSFADEDQKVYTSASDLSRELMGDWQKVFIYVKDCIRFEPSPYLLKSSQGVLWGRSGNAMEKAVLLMEVLKSQGQDIRLASGRLSKKNAANLIRSMFPERKDFSYGQEIPLSKPHEDNKLISIVKNHFWVQIKNENQWLDLDPTFSDAEPGKAYAEVEKTYTKLPDEVYPTMKISLSIEKGGKREDVLMLEQKLQDMANQPVTLSISTSFQESKEEASSGGTLGGAFGGLSRGASGKKGLTAEYLARLKIKEGMEVSGKFEEKIPEKSKTVADKDSINRVWINFNLILNGKTILETERVLFEKFRKKDEFPLFQRHSILISGNSIPLESWEKDLEKVTDSRLLEQVKSEVAEIKKSLKSKKDKKSLLKESLSLEEKLGENLGHLINMIFAYSSDSLTKDAGQALSVCSYYLLPRIILTSVAGDGKNVSTGMDLRQDSVAAVPYPGQALAMKETFLYGRGVFESVLEGKILELFLEKKVLTTAFIMREANKKKIPIRFYSELEKSELEKLGMPDPVLDRALKTIDSGSILIVPERSIRFNGKNRWGWWQIDPQTREATGVLDTGLHQAMFERTILDTEGMLNSKMGFTIGAITGAVDTQWMLATMVLKYGEINKAALEEIKAYMKELNAYMCPEFEISVSATIASATIIDIEDCYKKEYSLGFDGGVKIDMGWCQAFAKGFACASTSILNYYLSKYD